MRKLLPKKQHFTEYLFLLVSMLSCEMLSSFDLKDWISLSSTASVAQCCSSGQDLFIPFATNWYNESIMPLKTDEDNPITLHSESRRSEPRQDTRHPLVHPPSSSSPSIPSEGPQHAASPSEAPRHATQLISTYNNARSIITACLLQSNSACRAQGFMSHHTGGSLSPPAPSIRFGSYCHNGDLAILSRPAGNKKPCLSACPSNYDINIRTHTAWNALEFPLNRPRFVAIFSADCMQWNHSIWWGVSAVPT